MLILRLIRRVFRKECGTRRSVMHAKLNEDESAVLPFVAVWVNLEACWSQMPPEGHRSCPSERETNIACQQLTQPFTSVAEASLCCISGCQSARSSSQPKCLDVMSSNCIHSSPILSRRPTGSIDPWVFSDIPATIAARILGEVGTINQ